MKIINLDMKKLLILTLVFFWTVNSFGQNLDFTYKVDSTKTKEGTKYTVKINITSKITGPYTYSLFESKANVKQLVKTETTEKQTNIFEGLVSKSNYVIIVQLANSQEVSCVKTIKVN